MNSALPSRAVAERALHLAAAEWPGVAVNHYVVASGSTPGRTYEVYHDDVRDTWHCDCIGGQAGNDCSHAWAARAHADPAVRRQLRALVRGPRRMSREGAERLAKDYAQAAIWLDAELSFVEDDRNPVVAKRYVKLMDRIVARLTGHADAEADDE